MTRWPKSDLEGRSLARELAFMPIWRWPNADVSSLQAEELPDLESRRSRESVDEGKPGQNLRTLPLLHDNDYCVSDSQHSPFSRFSTF